MNLPLGLIGPEEDERPCDCRTCGGECGTPVGGELYENEFGECFDCANGRHRPQVLR